MARNIISLLMVIFVACAFVLSPKNTSAIEEKMDYRLVEKIKKAIEDLEDKKGSVRRDAKKDLIDWGEPAVEPLIAVVKDWRGKNADLRVECVDILGEIGDKRAVPVIIEVLDEDKLTMRYNAARALGSIGDDKATPSLIKLLGDSEWEARFFTAEALGKIGDNRAAKPLANVLLTDSHKKVRLEAIKALDKVNGKSEYRAVIDALSDGDPEVRGYAAELSASWNIQEALPIISNMIKDDRSNTARASCAHALGVYNNMAAVPSLIIALKDDYKDVRIYALESLKKISGQSYGFDQDKWQHWFELSKEKMTS
jgi:HEAT repeat protein